MHYIKYRRFVNKMMAAVVAVTMLAGNFAMPMYAKEASSQLDVNVVNEIATEEVDESTKEAVKLLRQSISQVQRKLEMQFLRIV